MSETIKQDKFGFVESHKCDSLFLSGLMSASGLAVDLEAAESETGQWFRRPVEYPECFSCKESRSTISRDQLLGVYWHAWVKQDREVLERIWDYGVRHCWRMGQGRYWGIDTIMNPPMISTLSKMLEVLGSSKGNWFATNLPTRWRVVTDSDRYYVNRLTALHLMLRRKVWGSLSTHSEDVLLDLRCCWPDNPLFTLASGDHESARWLINNSEGVPGGVHNDDEFIYERQFVLGMLNV